MTSDVKETRMNICPRQYNTDLERTTSIRLSEHLRSSAEQAASAMGMTFSQFVRQSLNRNIDVCQAIEEEVARQNFNLAAGKTQ